MHERPRLAVFSSETAKTFSPNPVQQSAATLPSNAASEATYRLPVAALNNESRYLLHQQISLCWTMLSHGSLCL
jgi:hypothetical protein